MDIDRCKCSECQSHTLAECISRRCYCCDLEDMFVVLRKADMEILRS